MPWWQGTNLVEFALNEHRSFMQLHRPVFKMSLFLVCWVADDNEIHFFVNSTVLLSKILTFGNATFTDLWLWSKSQEEKRHRLTFISCFRNSCNLISKLWQRQTYQKWGSADIEVRYWSHLSGDCHTAMPDPKPLFITKFTLTLPFHAWRFPLVASKLRDISPLSHDSAIGLQYSTGRPHIQHKFPTKKDWNWRWLSLWERMTPQTSKFSTKWLLVDGAVRSSIPSFFSHTSSPVPCHPV
jgi:hypothetical protein